MGCTQYKILIKLMQQAKRWSYRLHLIIKCKPNHFIYVSHSQLQGFLIYSKKYNIIWVTSCLIIWPGELALVLTSSKSALEHLAASLHILYLTHACMCACVIKWEGDVATGIAYLYSFPNDCFPNISRSKLLLGDPALTQCQALKTILVLEIT